jgi:hypothetical protein
MELRGTMGSRKRVGRGTIWVEHGGEDERGRWGREYGEKEEDMFRWSK